MERRLKYLAVFDGSVEENLKSQGFSTRLCSLLKKELGLVKVNGADKFVVDKARAGDEIEIVIKNDNIKHIEPFPFNIDIVYEDEDVAVIEKPPNIAVISTSAHYNVSLMNALASIWGDFEYHPVTRLDRGTSGLMLIAKHSLAHSLLNSAIAAQSDGLIAEKPVKREYFCLVKGAINGGGIIDVPIAHIDKSSYRRVVDGVNGKRAVTLYEVAEDYGDIKLVRLKLLTGRTHQIRVHMSYIGCPLLGDELYCGDITELNRPALHSCKLSFTHPITGESMTFNSDIPADMRGIIERQRKLIE